MDSELRQLVEDLRAAVAQALADSTEVDSVMRRVRNEGWSLYLVVDRKHKDDDGDRSFEVETETPRNVEVVFKIDGSDLSFLRSIGIDPTRKMRNRRPE